MKSAELRESFLNYFKKNGHQVVESSSLVPSNDPTLLFTNAGMVQFKDRFLGKETGDYSRATTSQKCVRAGGKHNDLENVGFTARHHTFFEMLGNFSFGDYFKKDAIHFAWEFVVRELGIDPKRLYVTVFQDDDEAADLWHKQESVPSDRIFRLGEKDNFWAMGDTGPCGPCSEIYVDRGDSHGTIQPKQGIESGSERFMEIWNLVFMQYDRNNKGELIKLPKPSVDTGMGLERTASVLQNVASNYEIDLFQNILTKISKAIQKPYDPKKDTAVSFRVIADHSRATAFLIADGVMPSNEGRGYVLRRIMRRAIRHGKKLGLSEPFLYETCGFVIDEMKGAYPQLQERKAFIQRAVRAEEEQFFLTLERGLVLLDEAIAQLGPQKKTLSGEVAFKLYDTFGFPIDLTRVLCEEKGLQVDEAGFEKSMGHQRSESRKHWKGSGDAAVQAIYFKIEEELKSKGLPQQFTGYDEEKTQGKVLGLIRHQGDNTESIQSFEGSLNSEDDFLEVVLDRTPFYGESGGQVGDHGKLDGNRFRAQVLDAQKPTGSLIFLRLGSPNGILTVGDTIGQTVDPHLRALTARNHTATHLLHWALRKVLGDHVKQAGSLVTPELLRFDFSHFEAVTSEQLESIENEINQKIWSGDKVSHEEMNRGDAEKKGAIAFFGEKYGSRVRVISVGEYSVEFCGGTHVHQSSDIHFFKIANESSIAAGVRRIIAHTSEGAFNYLRSKEQELKKLRELTRASADDEIASKIERMMVSEKAHQKEAETLRKQLAGQEVDELIAQAKKVGNAHLILKQLPAGTQSSKKLRDLGEAIRNKNPSVVAVLAMEDTEKATVQFLAVSGSTIMKSLGAQEVIQFIAPLIQGRGGGKAEMAQAGGTLTSATGETLQKVGLWIQQKLMS